MGDKKRLLLNMAAAVTAFLVQAGISFVLTPYVTATLGVEAYGFVTLSNSLASYVSVATVAVTSMSSRFISIELFREKDEKASRYYSSTLAMLLLCVVVVAVPSVVCIGAIDSILNISSSLVGDVRVLMLFVLANFSVSLMSSNLSIGFYVRNRLYIGSALNAAGYAIRAVLMVALFALLPAHVWFVGFATFAGTSLVQAAYLQFKRKLLPDLGFRARDVDRVHAMTVLKAGAWNSVTQLGSVLSNGLDVLVCNLLLGATPMGVLSVAKVIPQALDSVAGALTGSFQPTLMRLYAKGDIDGLIAYAKWSMRVAGLVIALPAGIFLALGVDFFKLWVPSQDPDLLFVLSSLGVLMWAFGGATLVIQNIFTVLNRIKVNSLLICLGGFAVVLVEVVFLKATDWGLYAIAATSFAERTLRNLAYVIPSGARYLDRPWWEFFPAALRSAACIIVVAACGLLMRALIVPDGWGPLIACGFAGIALGCIACMGLLFNREERRRVVGLLAMRFRR